MLFIVNVYDYYTSHRGARRYPSLLKPDSIFHVLDTDDFVVETITAGDLKRALESGLRFANFDMFHNRVTKQYITDLEEVLIYKPFYHKKDTTGVGELSFSLNNNPTHLTATLRRSRREADASVFLKMNEITIGKFKVPPSVVIKSRPRILLCYLFRLNGVWVLRFCMATDYDFSSLKPFFDPHVECYFPFTLLYDKDFNFIGAYGQDFVSSENPSPILAKFLLLGRDLPY